MNTLSAISAAARGCNLRFLLAGGHAVIAHGFPRNTFDLDLVVVREQAGRWRELLASMGYTPFREGLVFAQFNAASPDQLPLDLMLVNAATFEKMYADAIPGSGDTGGARVVSLQHLLALKCHAIKHGHEGRIVKDADDVIRLVQAHGIDVNQPEWRDMFLKFGTAELHEKLARITKAG
jgi:hypothetical protein